MFAIQQGCQHFNYTLFVNGLGDYMNPEGLYILANCCIRVMLARLMPSAVFCTL